VNDSLQVACSYFEQVQRHSNDYWSREEVLQKLDEWMADEFRDVHDRADREQLSLRDAAHFIAVDRVAQACRERGWV
jgi:glutamate dehydrogenase/leucine dehydrogenase